MTESQWAELAEARAQRCPLSELGPKAYQSPGSLVAAIALLRDNAANERLAGLARELAAAGVRVIAVGPSGCVQPERLGTAIAVPIDDGESPADRLPPCGIVVAGEAAVLPELYRTGRPLALYIDAGSYGAGGTDPRHWLLPDIVLSAEPAGSSAIAHSLCVDQPGASAWSVTPVLEALSRVAGSRPPRPGVPERPSISLCVIARNEQEMLPRMLASAFGAVDEIVVVDTGSTDDTVDVARSCGARVAFFEWCDDFAAARNYSIDQAQGDWIMAADADEVFTGELRREIRERAAVDGFDGYNLMLFNVLDNFRTAQHPVLRFFRRSPLIRFRGPIHEQVIYSIRENKGRVGLLTGRLLHFGYQTSLRISRHKRERNLRLLERAVDTDPANTYLRHQLSHEYLGSGDFGLSLAVSEPLMANLSPDTLLAGYVVSDRMLALISLDRSIEAIGLGMAYEPTGQVFPDIPFLTAVAAVQAEDYSLAQTIAEKLARPAVEAAKQIVTVFQGQESLLELRGDIALGRDQLDLAIDFRVRAAMARASTVSSFYRLTSLVASRLAPEDAFRVLGRVSVQSKEFLLAVTYAFLKYGYINEAHQLSIGLGNIGISTMLSADLLLAQGKFGEAANAYRCFGPAKSAPRLGLCLALLGDETGLAALEEILDNNALAVLRCLAANRPMPEDLKKEAGDMMALMLTYNRKADFIRLAELFSTDTDSSLSDAAKMLADHSFPDDAAKLLARTATLNAWAYGFLGRYFWDHGDRESAVPFLMRRLDQPDCPVGVYTKLAEYMASAGDREAAREVLGLGCRANPRSLDLPAARARLGL